MAEASEIVIGKIVAPFGVAGEVKVLVLTDFPARFGVGAKLRVRPVKGSVLSAEVERSREHKGGLVIKLAGVNTRSDAEALRNAEIVIDRSELAKLEQDSYYLFEIIGLRVVSTDGREWGEVTEILQGLANDVYVTSTGLCIPALKEVVAEVDVQGGRMMIRPYPGLLPEDR